MPAYEYWRVWKTAMEKLHVYTHISMYIFYIYNIYIIYDMSVLRCTANYTQLYLFHLLIDLFIYLFTQNIHYRQGTMPEIRDTIAVFNYLLESSMLVSFPGLLHSSFSLEWFSFLPCLLLLHCLVDFYYPSDVLLLKEAVFDLVDYRRSLLHALIAFCTCRHNAHHHMFSLYS